MPFPDRVAWFDNDRLCIRFSFSMSLKDQVKAIPGTRWSPHEKCWWVPATEADRVVPSLRELHFTIEDDPLPGGEAEPLRDGREPDRRSAQAVPAPNGQPALRVSELNRTAHQALSGVFPAPLWLIAEIDNLRARSGNYWFSLVERDAAGQITAAVPAVIFARQRTAIDAALQANGLLLEDELTVCMRCRVTLYEPRGTFQVIVDGVDPRHSLGDLARRKEEVLEQLRTEHLDRRALDRLEPLLPLRVALLTSREGDARADVLRTLEDSGYPFVVDAFDIRVQGPRLRATACAALDAVASTPDAWDVCLITRGGGSRSELGAWNDIQIARRIARLPVKTLVAIGHELDRCALDEIAWSERTPTAAAQALVARVAAQEQRLHDATKVLVHLAPLRLERAGTALATRAHRFERGVSRALDIERQRARTVWPERLRRGATSLLLHQQKRLQQRAHDIIARRTRARLAREHHTILDLDRRLARGFQHRILRGRTELSHLERRLLRTPPARLRHAAELLDSASARVRLAEPERLLARGLAVVRDADGHAIRSRSALVEGLPVRVEVADGGIAARLTEVELVDHNRQPTPSPSLDTRNKDPK